MKLILFKKIPKENKMAYLLSAGIGALIGGLMVVVLNFFPNSWHENSIFIFVSIAPIVIATIIFLSTLSNGFFTILKNIKTRIICVVILLIVYMYSFHFIFLLMSGDRPYKIIFLPFWIFFGTIFIFFTSSQFLLLPLICLSPFVVVATYLTTRGETNLPKKIILSLLVGLLIYLAAAIPLIMLGMRSFS